MRAWLCGTASQILVLPGLARARRAPFGASRRLMGAAPTIHWFHAVADPWSHLGAQCIPTVLRALGVARVRALAARWNARLVLRPVLPMVMRGLPVPVEKRMYIVRDCMREALRLGIPFGRMRDPVGPGVERGLAVLNRATALGRGPDFVESFLSGAFAEAVEADLRAEAGA
jgi:2-hydroxychromene-2-carboxylate isomerase